MTPPMQVAGAEAHAPVAPEEAIAAEETTTETTATEQAVSWAPGTRTRRQPKEDSKPHLSVAQVGKSSTSLKFHQKAPQFL